MGIFNENWEDACFELAEAKKKIERVEGELENAKRELNKTQDLLFGRTVERNNLLIELEQERQKRKSIELEYLNLSKDYNELAEELMREKERGNSERELRIKYRELLSHSQGKYDELLLRTQVRNVLDRIAGKRNNTGEVK